MKMAKINNMIQITMIEGKIINDNNIINKIHNFEHWNFSVKHFNDKINVTLIKKGDVKCVMHTMLLLDRKLYYFIEIPIEEIDGKSVNFDIHINFKEVFPESFG